MSVLLETSLGDITIDLFVDLAPKCCENFIKLCKIKYYNFSPVHTVQPNSFFQTGDPLGPGSKDSDGGTSIWSLLADHSGSSSLKTFKPEFHPRLKHAERGTISMASAPSTREPDQRESASQFIITLGDKLDYLDGKAAIFGRVVEGFDTLEKINTAFLDESGRPLRDIRIHHTIVLDEADMPDPPGLFVPASSPVPTAAQLATVRLADDEDINGNAEPEAIERLRREREARQQALTLEMVGDLPFAEVAPPENVIFVCKLNPVTDSDSLNTIFGRFGKILSCEVIREKRTGESLQYAFIEFAEKEMAENAYFRMQNVLIDDHRIHVDFSQSVSRLSEDWRNSTNTKRLRSGGGGGFGGIEELEKKRQYRAQGEDLKWHKRESDHQMVFDQSTAYRNGSGKPQIHNASTQRSQRSRSPHSPPSYSRRHPHHDLNRERHRERDGGGRLDRSQDYSQDRYRDRDRDGKRQPDRDWGSNQYRHREEDRYRDREREDRQRR